MQRLPIKLATAGMKLAKEASTPEGQVLCGPGTMLTETLLLRLAKAGIHTVTVEGHPVRMPGEKSLNQRLNELHERFTRVKEDPVLRALERLIAEFWIVQEKGKDALERLKKEHNKSSQGQ